MVESGRVDLGNFESASEHVELVFGEDKQDAVACRLATCSRRSALLAVPLPSTMIVPFIH